MQCRSAFIKLVLLLGWAALSLSSAPAQSSGGTSFDVQISLSQKAAAKLASLDEGIVVAATYSGDPAPVAEARADQIGGIDLGREAVKISGRPQTAHITGPHISDSTLAEIQGPILLNVNVYSARRSGPDNILNCDSFDGDLRQVVHQPLAIYCALISEKPENSKDGVSPIPTSRVADSYAIYAMLLPGAPSDTISPSQIQNWSLAGTTVSIADMNPAIPPDGQLKAPPDNPEAFSEALQDFEVRKYQRFQLDSTDFHPHASLPLIDNQQVVDLRRSGTNNIGIAFFSAVYFNDDQTAALVYMNDWCANFCAAGQWVYLEKHGGQWVRRSGILAKGA